MKQIKCSELSGSETCDVVIKAETAQEMLDTAWVHLQEVHPEVVKNIINNPKEENDKWMEEFKANFENLENAEEEGVE